MAKKLFALPAIGLTLAVLACSFFLYTPLPESVPEQAKLQVLMGFFKILRAMADIVAFFGPHSHIETMNMMTEMTGAQQYYSAAAGDVKLTETEMAGVPVVIYRPVEADTASAPATVFFHGGGFVLLSTKAYDFTTYDIARGTKTVVVSVDYRKAPKHPFPAAVHDCLNVTRHLLREGQRYGIDVNRIGVAGDSAGGNLATVVALHLGESRKTAEDQGLPTLKFQALFYPLLQAVDFWLPSYMDNNDVTPAILNRNFIAYLLAAYFGLGPQARSYSSVIAEGGHIPLKVQKEYSKHVDRSRLYEQEHHVDVKFPKQDVNGNIRDPYSPARGDTENPSLDWELHKLLANKVTDPMFSPFFAEDVSVAPPTFLHVAEFDVLRDEGLLYASKLRDAGVKVKTHLSKGGVHGEITKVGTKHLEFQLGEIALEKMYEFVKETLRSLEG
ncbi:hypothetical protein EGW08_013815 [Elysia chlorotica]|uniref:Alpha/beta hydrolase fold-3 domain-containing protein n=1 Tax=Elysia chlorotica TaxID=188477 RepID=A0A3S1B9N5_ELYCH|nr:hypothetical protein EGW08_013815 [Elysia chlorotica]